MDTRMKNMHNNTVYLSTTCMSTGTGFKVSNISLKGKIQVPGGGGPRRAKIHNFDYIRKYSGSLTMMGMHDTQNRPA
jgi:hypothetical protein